MPGPPGHGRQYENSIQPVHQFASEFFKSGSHSKSHISKPYHSVVFAIRRTNRDENQIIMEKHS